MTQSVNLFIDNACCDATAIDAYRAVEPTTAEAFGPTFPVPDWSDVDAALTAVNGVASIEETSRAALLCAYADAIDASKAELATIAERETALPARERFVAVDARPRENERLH